MRSAQSRSGTTQRWLYPLDLFPELLSLKLRCHFLPSWQVRLVLTDFFPNYNLLRTMDRAMDDWEEQFHEAYGTPEGRPRAVSKTRKGHLYHVLEKLDKNGQGALNQGIFLVRRKSNRDRFVEKRIDMSHKLLLREIYFLKSLEHPNIIKFIDAFIANNPKEASVYVEYCNRGNLLDLVKNYRKHNRLYPDRPVKIPESFIWHVFASLASALQYIHHGIPSGNTVPRSEFPNMTDDEIATKYILKWDIILHRDIKLENVFLRAGRMVKHVREKRRPFPLSFLKREVIEYRSAPFPRVILADFGISTKRGHADFEEIEAGNGTPLCWPPELTESTVRADVWVLGGVILSLCKLLKRGPLPPPPKEVTTPSGRYEWETSKEARIGMELQARVGDHYSPHLDDIVYNCMRDEKNNRPFAFKLVEDIQEARLRAKQEGWLREKELPPWAFERTRN